MAEAAWADQEISIFNFIARKCRRLYFLSGTLVHSCALCSVLPAVELSNYFLSPGSMGSKFNIIWYNFIADCSSMTPG